MCLNQSLGSNKATTFQFVWIYHSVKCLDKKKAKLLKHTQQETLLKTAKKKLFLLIS